MNFYKFLFLVTIIPLCISLSAQSQKPELSKQIVLLKPTGETINGYPEMEKINDTSKIYIKIKGLIDTTFIGEAVNLYFFAQQFLLNKGIKEEIDPAYLALSTNDGGYAKKGFYLKQGSKQIDKENTNYIDLVETRILSSPNRLMSVTQLYPHEMGHLIYELLTPLLEKNKSINVDMHYFSVKTNFATAFNEGFAEHIENIAREFEPSEIIKKAINSDAETIERKSNFYINGLQNDLTLPFRFGFFKIAMPVWFQKYENYKRYKFAYNGKAQFQAVPINTDDIEDRLTTRNAAIQISNNMNNYLQSLITEGVISSFFTKLTQSELGKSYLDKTFYFDFLQEEQRENFNPQEYFSPWQNQFLKYFSVFYELNNGIRLTKSDFINFLETYFKLFPDEKEIVKTIFKETTGHNYSTDIPNPIWLIAPNHNHRILSMDMLGSFTVPYYTFSLNAASEDDLLTLGEITFEEAESILKYRNDNGFFNNLNEIKNINNISESTKNIILNSKYDEKLIDKSGYQKLNFLALISTSLINLFSKIILCFIVFTGIGYWFILRKKEIGLKRSILLGIYSFIQWTVFVFAGLTFIIISESSWPFIIILLLIFVLLNSFFYRKTAILRNYSLTLNLIMSLLLIYSTF